MLFELNGLGNINKGAYLMFLSILEATREQYPSATFCADLRGGFDYHALASHGVLQKIPTQSLKQTVTAKIVNRILPTKTRKAAGLKINEEVDVILDGSGFGYGDFWKYRDNSYYIKHIKAVKARKGHFFLLPQALGPFELQKTRKEFGEIVKLADLVLARDSVSYDYLTKTYGQQDHFKQFPDFTNLLATPPAQTYEEGNIVIVPNFKMLKNEANAKDYYSFLSTTIKKIQSYQHNTPYFLIHEGKQDFEIAQLLNEKFAINLPICWPKDPLEVKHRIKSAKYCVTSRFHGLVSSLSQNIPAISTSWSHKYEMLMKDYQTSKLLVDFKQHDAKHFESLVEKLEDDVQRAKIIARIEQNSTREKAKSKEMWQEVFKNIKQR